MAETETAPVESLSLVVFSGSYEKVHYALVMASAALASNRKVTLFFTMEASHALFAPSGWRHLKPEMQGATASTIDMSFGQKGIGTFEELLGACQVMGARFIVCEMGLRALGLENKPLRDELAVERAGVVTFLNDSQRNGQMMFV